MFAWLKTPKAGYLLARLTSYYQVHCFFTWVFSVCMTMYKCMFFTLTSIRRKTDGKTHQINSKIKVIYMNKN